MKVKFFTDSGQEVESYIDENLQKNLEDVKDSVLNKGWDYVGVVSGIVGVGKSTFAQKVAKYLDPTFNTKERICFTGTGKDGLLERTANAKHGQAFILDESFADLNTKVTKGSEFVRIINHLQLIRQKGLYLILCLPNFFDLSKGMAVFRASHLFVVYHDGFNRGYFAAFGRDEKRKLYVKGGKYMDYNAEKPNFRGRFTKEWIADQQLYEKLKAEHLQAQAADPTKQPKVKETFSRKALKRTFLALRVEGYTDKEIIKMANVSNGYFYGVMNEDNTVGDGE